MATGVSRRGDVPPSALETLADFGRPLGLDLRAWHVVEGERRPVFPVSAHEPPDPNEYVWSVDAGAGTTLDVQVVGHGAESPLLRVLASTLQRDCARARRMAELAGGLEERDDEIGLLYLISETLASVLHVEKAASRILEEVSRVLSARRASLWIHSPEDGLLRLAASVGGVDTRDPIPVDHSGSVTARVFRASALASGDGSEAPEALGEPQGEWLSVPVTCTVPSGDVRSFGVLNLIGREQRGPFSEGDRRLLVAVAAQVGAALETNRLISEISARERMSLEMELAHDLQTKLLPPIPPIAGMEAVARVLPTASVGGDFYRVFELSGGRVGIMIGDVSGHGFSAAMIMALVMSAAAIYAQQEEAPAQVLRYVDRAIGEELESTEMFLSLCYCVLSPQSRRITYSNAGHPHAFVLNSRGEATRLGATDPPMGIGQAPYGESTAEWIPEDDVLLLFTDGLSDSLAQLKRTSGEQLVLRTVARHRGEPVARILDRLFEMSVQVIPALPTDDRTAVLLRATSREPVAP